MSSATYFPDAPVVVLADDSKVYQFPTAAGAEQFEFDVARTGGQSVRLAIPEPPLPAVARPLYEMEAHLASLVDTEDLITREQEQEYALELHAELLATEAKRDRVGHFRQQLIAMAALAKAEVERVQARQKMYERGLERMDAYLTRVIDMLGFDAKGKRKKLEGSVCTIGLHGCDKRAEVTDEEAVPSKYKRITVTLPLDSWELVKDSVDMDLREQIVAEATSIRVEVSASLVKADLKADIEVPGAKLAGGTYVEVK